MAAPPMPTTTPMTVFLVLVLMPDEEEVLSLERAAVPVDIVAPMVVEEDTEVTSEPETVMTEVMRSTLV